MMQQHHCFFNKCYKFHFHLFTQHVGLALGLYTSLPTNMTFLLWEQTVVLWSGKPYCADLSGFTDFKFLSLCQQWTSCNFLYCLVWNTCTFFLQQCDWTVPFKTFSNIMIQSTQQTSNILIIVLQVSIDSTPTKSTAPNLVVSKSNQHL